MSCFEEISECFSVLLCSACHGISKICYHKKWKRAQDMSFRWLIIKLKEFVTFKKRVNIVHSCGMSDESTPEKGLWSRAVCTVHTSWMKVKGCQLSNSIARQISQSFNHPALNNKMYTGVFSKESWKYSFSKVQLPKKIQHPIPVWMHHPQCTHWIEQCLCFMTLNDHQVFETFFEAVVNSYCEDGLQISGEVEGVCESNQCGTCLVSLLCRHWHVLHALTGYYLTNTM